MTGTPHPDQSTTSGALTALMVSAAALLSSAATWLTTRATGAKPAEETPAADIPVASVRSYTELRRELSRKLDSMDKKISDGRDDHQSLRDEFQDLKVTLDSINQKLLNEIFSLREQSSEARTMISLLSQHISDQRVALSDIKQQLNEMKQSAARARA